MRRGEGEGKGRRGGEKIPDFKQGQCPRTQTKVSWEEKKEWREGSKGKKSLAQLQRIKGKRGDGIA